MINAVTYKTAAAYKGALSDKNILQTHEPFNIIVYDDPTPVTRDRRVIDRIVEVTNINKIPTGKAILITNHLDPETDGQRGRYAYAEKLLRDRKYRVDFNSVILGIIVIQIPSGSSFDKVEDLINEELYGTPVFIAIEEDVIFTAESTDYVSWPIGSQWHLTDIEAPSAYNSFANGVIYNSIQTAEWFTKDVAILDGSGIEIDHPDLFNTDRPVDHPGYRSTRASWNCVNNTANVQAIGPHENHGTVMAGIAGSQWADHRFLRGVGLDHINVQHLKIGYNMGPTGSFNTTPGIIYRALIKAVFNENCVSIAMPFTWNFYFAALDALLNRITKYTRLNKGIPIFAPSGNSGASSITTQFPGAYESVLVIGSSNQDHEKSDFSSYGGNIFAAAPGEGILAIDRLSVRGYNQNPDPNYGSVTNFSGTSASCVIAATIAATMTVAYPGISFLEIKYALAQTARRLGPYTYSTADPNPQPGVSGGMSPELGNGILTQYAAILKALELSEQFLDISVAITDLNFQWAASMNGPWYPEPLISGTYFQTVAVLEVTNNSTNPITYALGQDFPVGVFLATDDTGNLSSIFRSHTMALQLYSGPVGGTTILPGETTEILTRKRTAITGGHCDLNGSYYGVAKYRNPLISSAEDVTLIEEVVFDNVTSDLSDLWCANQLMPVNNDAELRISNLTVSRIGTTSEFTVSIRLTNIGSSPIYGCRIQYYWYPSGDYNYAYGGAPNTALNVNYAIGSNGVIGALHYSNYYVPPVIDIVNENPVYATGYPAEAGYPPNMPILQPGQSAVSTIHLFMNPFVSPAVLIANVTSINQVLTEVLDPINHVTQSSVLLIE